ncbi:hypothetical protein TYRP_011586 [Tyrophagus putrescentiae]|nr:hypothetical protein TYRP_011586 [Tyrophagus putrescentiae]
MTLISIDDDDDNDPLLKRKRPAPKPAEKRLGREEWEEAAAERESAEWEALAELEESAAEEAEVEWVAGRESPAR